MLRGERTEQEIEGPEREERAAEVGPDGVTDVKQSQRRNQRQPAAKAGLRCGVEGGNGAEIGVGALREGQWHQQRCDQEEQRYGQQRAGNV